MKKITLVLLISVLGSLSLKAQQRYVQVSPEVAYWNAFNASTNRLYNAAYWTQRVATPIVNYGSQFAGGQGGTLSNAYNVTQRYVQQNVRLPQRYAYHH